MKRFVEASLASAFGPRAQLERRHRLRSVFNPGVNLSAVEALVQNMPQAVQDFHTLIAGSHQLYDEHGIVPDSKGDNLVVASEPERLIVIDGQPITDQYPQAQAQMLRALEDLNHVLGRVLTA